MAGELLVAGEPIKAHDDGDSRWYTHPVTGAQYVSVTYVLGRSIGKPWLAAWASKIAAEFAVDFTPLWQAAARDARAASHGNPDDAARAAAVDMIKQHATRQRALKADLGSWWHAIAEALVLNAPLPDIPEHLAGELIDWGGEVVRIDQEWLDRVADGFLTMVSDFERAGMVILAAECVVASDDHAAAGTIDLIVRMPDGRILILDIKTGAHLGAEIKAQLAAYHRFGTLWLRDGRILRKPRTSGAAVLHLRPEYRRGYKVLPVTASDLAGGWAWWQACRAQLTASERVTGRFADVYYPPRPDGTQPPPMVEDLLSYPGCSRAVRPLTAAGWEWLADVAVLTRGDLLALPGVGPRTVDALAKVLDEHGLTFAADAA